MLLLTAKDLEELPNDDLGCCLYAKISKADGWKKKKNYTKKYTAMLKMKLKIFREHKGILYF